MIETTMLIEGLGELGKFYPVKECPYCKGL
jgi:hypothetical protein